MHANERGALRFSPQTVIALLVIFFGLVKTADNLGWVHASSVLRLWPLGLIAIGSIVYSRADDRSNRIMGGVIAGAGVWLAAAPLFGAHVSLFDLWPLVLVGAGVTIIMRARQEPTPVPTGSASLAGSSPMPGDQHVSALAFWAGIKRRVTSQVFRRADLTAVMGGIELDLRGANLAEGGAVIDVFVMMGGLEIRVPPGWFISNEVAVIMGGVDDKTQVMPAATSRLTLRGFVVMGGIELKD